MKQSILDNLSWMENQIETIKPMERVGRVLKVSGLIIESEGPEAAIGNIVSIHSHHDAQPVRAEVVGFRDNHVLLMPLDPIGNIHPGCRVAACNTHAQIPIGDSLLGRIINGFGKPIDGRGNLRSDFVHNLHNEAPNPMLRQQITLPFETGVKAIDAFTPLGCGQRMGIFAGSGVGKSTLLGMIARGSEADINVIALIGERGRELREFIENELGPEGMKKTVVVVSTSDQSAPLRLRAAFMATRIAEHFRDQGKKVMFLMDSVTRLAMAQREIGLSVGEPPTSRGYTPSVFSLLPRILERSGMNEKGSITALYTVLVEGDDLNEPIADAVRGILDGHIVLNRSLATSNHFPAIDVLESVSRLVRSLCSEEDLGNVSLARDLLSLYQKNEDLINIGAYAKNTHAKLDLAIAKQPLLMEFLAQNSKQLVGRDESLMQLKKILK